MPTLEITMGDLLSDHDWLEVFGEEGNYGNTSDKTDECPPGAGVDRTPPKRTDVAEIIAAVNGERDEKSWVGVFRLRDGRFLAASGGCDYTGWD